MKISLLNRFMSRKYILLTFDVEDWFQVENLKPWIDRTAWNTLRFRVEKNINRILDILDSAESIHAADKHSNIRATFFVLGWIAERLPSLVQEISNRGHELSSHGYDHRLCTSMNHVALKQDLERSKKIIEDITSRRVKGFRASSFSIDDKTLKMVADSGYNYDSSYNSFKFHNRYGTLNFDNSQKINDIYEIRKNFYEIPISNIKIFNTIIPWGGGAYFRLLPYRLFEIGVRFIHKKMCTYTFYLHPWEIDPMQPKLNNLPNMIKLRHYSNLSKTEIRFKKFLKTFSYCKFISCDQYLIEKNML